MQNKQKNKQAKNKQKKNLKKDCISSAPGAFLS